MDDLNATDGQGSHDERVPEGLEPVNKQGMTFGKTVLASGLGFAAATVSLVIVFGFLGAMLFGALVSGFEESEAPSISEGSLLEIPMDRSYPEVMTTTGFDALFSFDESLTFLDLVRAIDHAATDDRIAGIRMNFNGFSGSGAQIEELVEAMQRFRANGKPIYAMAGANGLAEAEYVVASATDSIFLRPQAGVELNGIYVVLEYYRPLMRKLNVEPIVIKAGSYKSAVEPFLLDGPSAEGREAIESVIGDIQDRYLEIIAENRDMQRSELDSIMNSWPLMRSDDAFDVGLVDVVAEHDEIEDIVRERFDVPIGGEEAVPAAYLSDYVGDRSLFATDARDDIAVVYAVGGITSDRGGPGIDPFTSRPDLTDVTFIEDLRIAREDEDVRAIVLRIDSPGGELSPSATMWREMRLAAEEKPLVVSMGGVAASGGYYIAAPAREIFADATTITGSIGVFALAFNIDGLYEETIGINTEIVKTAPHADLLSLMRDLDAEERVFAEQMIRRAYEDFLTVVSEGRDMSRDDVDSVAQGRIWTGRQAKEHGLVDEVGGLTAAIERAAELAEIEEYGLRVIPRPESGFERFMSSFAATAESAGAIDISTDPRKLERQLRDRLVSRSGLQVRLDGIRGLY